MLKGEVLVLISEDSPVNHSKNVEFNQNKPTITGYYFKELTENPYKYNESELRFRVHVEIRGKKNLKLDSYSMKRSEILKKYGWGLHVDSNHKLALVPVESERYKTLLADSSVKKIKAYRSSKK